MSVTSEDLEKLLPGERAAMEEDAEDPGAPPDYEDEDAEDAEGDEGEDGGEESAEEGEEAGEEQGEAERAAEQAHEEPQAQADDEDPYRDPDDDVLRISPTAVLRMARDDAQYQESLKELDAKFEAGEFTVAQLMQEKDRLLEEAQARVEPQALNEARWDRVCSEFFKAHPQIAPSQQNKALFEAFNEELVAFAATDGAKNKSGTYIINKAYEQFQEKLASITGAPIQPKAPEKKAEAKPKLPRPKAPDAKRIPPNLAGLPDAGDPIDTGEGKFAHLDRLAARGDAMALERALSRLSPAEQQEYLES